jgi:hypothetical protein
LSHRKFVFPQLHGKEKEQVAKDITNVIRYEIPDKEVKMRYSSRSERRGSASELAAHRDISYSELIARGGWGSTQKNADVYREEAPVLSKPGAMCVSGYHSCHEEVYPP